MCKVLLYFNVEECSQTFMLVYWLCSRFEPGFGAQPQPGFGAQSQPGFGAQPQPGFGAPAANLFGGQPGTPAPFAQNQMVICLYNVYLLV
jgi:hypothetical protein